MSPLIRSIVFASLMLACLGTPANAQTPDQARIKELERENDELRVELAQLRLQLSQLKRELDQHKAEQQPEAEPNDDEPMDQADPDSDRAADEEDEEPLDKNKPRTFRSADEIYRSIPQDMRPSKDGWDIQERVTVGEWLKTNITGKRFESRKEISQVNVKYDTVKRLWEMTLYFEDEEMRYMSWNMQEKLNGITLRGDKEFVENARKKYKVGGTVNVSGTILRIAWDTLIFQNAEKNWHPKHCTLTLDAVQIK